MGSGRKRRLMKDTENRRNGGGGMEGWREKDVGKPRGSRHVAKDGQGQARGKGAERGPCEEGERAGEGWGVPGGRGGWVTHAGVPFDMPGEHSSTQGTLHGQGGIGPAVAAGSEVRPRMEGGQEAREASAAGLGGTGRVGTSRPGDTARGEGEREAGDQILSSGALHSFQPRPG